MIKRVEVSIPEWWIDIKRDFKKGLNLIDEPNSWGKSTLIFTVASLYSKKFPWLRTLPWTAKIDDAILIKWMWMWAPENKSELLEYLIPWKFFDLSTTDQRRLFTELLDIEFDTFMSSVDGWTPTRKTELRRMIKEKIAQADIVTEDIKRLQVEVRNFKDEDHTKVITYLKKLEEVKLEWNKYNNNLDNKQPQMWEILSKKKQELQQLENENLSIQRKIDACESKLEDLRKQYTTIATTCPTCGHDIDESKISDTRTHLKAHAEEITQEMNQYTLKDLTLVKEELNVLQKEYDSYIPPKQLTLEEFISIKDIQIDTPTPKEAQAYEEYKEYKSSIGRTKSELEVKMKQIKDLDYTKLQAELKVIEEKEKEFTSILQEKVNSTGLEIELFKTAANGNVSATFNVKLDWVDYKDLSWGKKLLVWIKVAKLISDKFDIKTLLIDEAGLLSNDSFEYIRELAKDYQVIVARATPFTL